MRKRTVKSIRRRMVVWQIMITLSALCVCGVVLLVSMFFQLGQYIRNDMEYYMRSVNNELSSKIAVLSNAVIAMRNNDDIIAYLEKAAAGSGSQEDMDTLSRRFIHAAGMYTDGNLAENGVPFMETLVLFDDGGNSISAHYYSLQSDMEARYHTHFYDIYAYFREKEGDGDTLFIPWISDDAQIQRIYLCRTLYNRNFDPVGTLIFSVRQDSLLDVFQRSENYPNTIWDLSSSDGQSLASYNAYGFGAGELARAAGQALPGQASALSKDYIIDTREFSMNLRSIVAIPRNHVNRLLLSAMWMYILAIILLVIVGAVCMFFATYRMTRPLHTFTKRLVQVREGDFTTKLPDYSVSEFQEISQSFNAMTDYIDYLVQQVYEKQLLITQAELKFIRAQMNPHFLFNALNAIALQAKFNRDDEVHKMLTAFSQLIQATLFRKGKDKVTIRQELQYVEYYLSLQHMRYGDRLLYEFIVSDDTLLDFFIPKLCLQLVVENAVVHGIEPKAEKSRITVSICAEDNDIVIEAVDDGVGFAGSDGEIALPLPEKEQTLGHNRIGLNNAYKIIQITYGMKYGIRIFSCAGKGSRIVIRIPFDKGENGSDNDK